jgi:hypothetical protein
MPFGAVPAPIDGRVILVQDNSHPHIDGRIGQVITWLGPSFVFPQVRSADPMPREFKCAASVHWLRSCFSRNYL